ncbi:MAG: ribosomal L7Ae/L30e/S12e/Gadd45 family protein [Clostridia bacterium]|nr:ribosomal L7Ae/L30e/S12e/Gadd45 family protein [Clostridia bacterium]
MDNRFWGSLGLSSKAGKLIYGVPMIIEAMQKGKKVYLVIEAGDTSDNTHKKITDKCLFYGVEKIRIDADGGELASRIGKSSSLAAVAITDESFYKMVSKNISDNQ